MNIFKKATLLIIFSCSICCVTAQLTPAVPLPFEVQELINSDTSQKIAVSSISITGNKRTKDYIIRRELLFKEGDSISHNSIATIIQNSRSLVYNTTLFTAVEIIPAINNGTLAISVIVKEKWYLYPTPQFKLVDRNLNEWIKTYNASLERVVYGVKFAHFNFSGRRDHLRIYLLTGYARNISFSYSAPYSNSALTEGFGVSAGFTQNREVSYRTTKFNSLANYNDGSFVRESFGVSGAYIIRRGHYNSHVISVAYSHIKVTDSVVTKSAQDYFNSDKNRAGFPEVAYAYRHVNVDNVAYPLKGNAYTISVLKRGTGLKGGINLFETGGAVALYKPHGKNWYSSFGFSGKVKMPFDLAYINRRAFGFNDFYLRGLEYYVIDGVAAALAQYTLKKKVISFNIPLPFNIKAFPKIPVAIYGKAYADAGTSSIPTKFNSMLNNRLLYTSGFGLDILTLYDITVKLEYSFNQLGENGLFLHMRGGF